MSMTYRRRSGVSHIVGVMLMIVIVVAAMVILWAYLSGYIGARTAPASQNTVFQINALTKGASPVASVQLVGLGRNATIVAVYMNGAAVAGFTPSPTKFAPGASEGEIVSITWTSPALVNGDLVKIVCADGGAASLTAT